MKQNQFKINNQGDDIVELLIYGIVGSYWDENDAKDIVSAIRAITAKKILVRIYSEGGSVFAGLAIYNALKQHPADVVVRIDSLAASIASVIAMAGTVEMPENAFMVIHNPWGGVVGEAHEMAKMAEILAGIKNSLITVYKSKTALEDEQISSMMDDETWMMAKKAVELGFADTVLGAADPKNALVFNHLKNFQKIPEQIQRLLKDPVNACPEKPKHKENKSMDLVKLKAEHPDLYKAIFAEGAKSGAQESFKKGADSERQRIQDVLAQSMPGHEKLINELAFDGKTTGPEAAVKVIVAEKQIRNNARQDIADDKIDPVNPATPADGDPSDTVDPNLPIEEQATAEWQKDAKLRNEFSGDYETFLAYRRNVQNVKSIGSKKEI